MDVKILLVVIFVDILFVLILELSLVNFMLYFGIVDVVFRVVGCVFILY